MSEQWKKGLTVRLRGAELGWRGGAEKGVQRGVCGEGAGGW